MTSREITDGIVQEFLAGALHQRREAGKRVFAEETLIAVGTQVNRRFDFLIHTSLQRSVNLPLPQEAFGLTRSVAMNLARPFQGQ